MNGTACRNMAAVLALSCALALAAGQAFAADIGFAVTSFKGTEPIALNGAASFAGGALLLTSTARSVAGSAFYREPLLIGPDTSFATQFRFSLSGGRGARGAEGFTFVIHNSPSTTLALGEPGGRLGYDVAEGSTGARVAPSLAIEFDTRRDP